VLSSRPLFQVGLPNNAGFYDVTRDGKQFLVVATNVAPNTMVGGSPARLIQRLAPAKAAPPAADEQSAAVAGRANA